jgi:hypothetical protein
MTNDENLAVNSKLGTRNLKLVVKGAAGVGVIILQSSISVKQKQKNVTSANPLRNPVLPL